MIAALISGFIAYRLFYVGYKQRRRSGWAATLVGSIVLLISFLSR